MNNNQQLSSNKKTLIIFIVIIVIAGVYYFYSLGSSTPDSNSSFEQTDITSNMNQIAGTRVLSLLNQVSSLKIDKTLFENQAYKSLVDYSISIPEQNIGRPNPFAPIGGITPVNTSTTTVKTH